MDTVEFSPVDDTAKAVITLCQYHNQEFSIYHACNSKNNTFNEIVKGFQKIKIDFEPVSSKWLQNKFRNSKYDDNLADIHQIITRTEIFDLQKPVIETSISTSFTKWFLKKCNFTWNSIDQNYIDRFVEYYDEINFWNREQEKRRQI
jgi:hypothetical protein